MLQPGIKVIPLVHGIQSIAWPFVIFGSWFVLVSIGFFILSLASSLVSMPQFYDNENTNKKGKDDGPAKLSYIKKRVFLFLIIVFFALSGAVIRVFQSMAMTFGMCGPLQLESHMAAITDSFYSTGMCVGRFASILLAMKLLPSTLLVLCMFGCTIAAVFLIILAPVYHLSLYTGVGLLPLISYFLSPGRFHGIFYILAIWHRLLLDLPPHEHHWTPLLHLLHR